MKIEDRKQKYDSSSNRKAPNWRILRLHVLELDEAASETTKGVAVIEDERLRLEGREPALEVPVLDEEEAEEGTSPVEVTITAGKTPQ